MTNAVGCQPPELLAPAGDWDCVKAAIANGADAVYFGLQGGFNARYRAANFELTEIPTLMGFLAHHGVRGYVTLNTLAFSRELPELEALLRTLVRAGVDALLVQDLGLARLVRAISPDLPIHASTQMTITSSECLQALDDLQIERVVLARELSLREIAKIREQVSTPLEVFVHGALCVAYSGQCLTSESFGGRSANRGQCAQACRLPYDLICDGKDVDLGDQKYLLSPQDLAAYALVDDLIAAGVSSLKIEGRLKTPEYVANITRHYRRAIDSAVQGNEAVFTPLDIEEMELSFSRGFSVGWLHGCDHKMLAPGFSSAKRGVRLGSVVGVRKGRVIARLERNVRPGDGLVFEGGRIEGEEQGGRVYDVRELQDAASGNAAEDSGRLCELGFKFGSLDLTRLLPGLMIWKSDDPQLTKRLRKTYTGKIEGKKTKVFLSVRAAANERLKVTIEGAGFAQTFYSPEPLAVAVNRPATNEFLREQFDRLASAGCVLDSWNAEIIGQPMVPLSVLGALRKSIVDYLSEHAARTPQIWTLVEEPALPRLKPKSPSVEAVSASGPRILVMCRSLPQLRDCLALGEREVYADFQDIREYREGGEAAASAGAKLWLATPRIQKPDEMGVFTAIAKQKAHGMLVRNMAGLQFCRAREIPFVADFSLNAANELTVDYLQGRGAERVTVSYDLNRDQIAELVRESPGAPLEVVIHQHMPLFHMEHCVFCAVLSPGTNKTNCGRPCDTHEVKLRDRLGQEHPLKADVGCRNTLFNAVAQSGAEVVPQLMAMGVCNYRVEFLGDETSETVSKTAASYRELLAGKRTAKEVWASLKASNRLGVTRGALEERRNPLSIL